MKKLITLIACTLAVTFSTATYGQEKLEALEVTRVDIADGMGHFTQNEDNTWSAMIEGNPCVLVENNRDQWSIYLTATETKAPFAINLWKEEITINGKASYKVGGTSASPVTNVGSTSSNLTNVVTVTYKTGNSLGYFINDGTKSWGEYGANKEKRFSFEETARTATSIDLFDKNRGYKIKLDLTSNKILLNGNPLYTISKSSNKDELANQGSVVNSGNTGNTSTSNTGEGTTNNPSSFSTNVTIENCGEHAIIVFRENEATGTKEEIKRIAPTRPLKVDANLGDIFSFVVEGDASLAAENFVVVDEKMDHCVKTNQVFANSGETTTRIGNASASRNGYDLLKIDPMYIHYNQNKEIKDVTGKPIGAGGQRAQIFDNLERQDIDWGEYDKNIALKLHFKGKAINTGRGAFERSMFHSEQGFKEGFSANIGVSGGVEGDAGPVAEAELKASASASFSHTTEENKSNKTVYITNSITQEWYDIELNHDYIDFTRPFINDVKNLNKPSNKNNLEAYKKFISKYGTHYPLQTTYGAKMMSIEKYSYEDLSKTTSWGVDLSAEVSAKGKFKGVGVERGGSGGFGYNQTDSYKNMEEKNTKMYQYIGGKASAADNWDVDANTVVPIDITLARISNLIDKKYFPYLPDVDFEGIKNMMAKAITQYIGSPTDTGKSMKPNVYKITNIEFKNIDWLDDTQIYGDLNASSPNGTSRLWYVKDDAWGPESDKFLHVGKKGKRTEIPHRENDKLIEEETYAEWIVPAGQEQQFNIKLGGSLYRWHPLGRTDGQNEEGDRIDTAYETVNLFNVQNRKKVTVTFDEKVGKCQVIFTVEKQTFPFRD